MTGCRICRCGNGRHEPPVRASCQPAGSRRIRWKQIMPEIWSKL